jgi:ribonuclease-3
VAYKEVNFKSKLLEWTQKNRVKMEFRCMKQTSDEKGSPVFGFQVMIEGVAGGKGQGYSKKEAQQESSKETLQRLRREPQFIDAIFAAKSSRTKMEEEPTAIAPDLEAEKEFIIKSEKPEKPKKDKKPDFPENLENPDIPDHPDHPAPPADTDEFDLSDITHNPEEPSREDIIAAAEAAAYQEKTPI